MKRKILLVTPALRDTVEALLGEMLGEGWGPGCLTGYPQPSTPAQARPEATVYLCDAHLPEGAVAKIASVAAVDAALTLTDARAVNEKQPDGPRKTLAESLAAHAAKEGK